MCDLCNPETRTQAVARSKSVATALEELAQEYRALAIGSLLPHSDRAKIVAIHARGVIRALVEDYV